jgi:endonuclease/exonuclease/phosphatase family metal-dependent hydrolase
MFATFNIGGVSMRLLFILFLIISSSFSYSADISENEPLEVITFNVGYARARIFNLVPCIRQRVKLLRKVIDDKLSREKGAKVFLFQEFFSRRAFKKLINVANKHSYDYYPKEFKDLKKNGTLILTNLETVKHEWVPFEAKKYPGINRGIRLIYTKTLEGRKILIGNTHTAYSGRKKTDKTHLAHLDQIADTVRDKTSDQYNMIFGGDLNVGSTSSFKRQKYDPIEEIWIPFYQKILDNNMKFLEYESPSWDETKNPFVFRPSLFARWFATDNGKWDDNTSDIDHLFVSNSLKTENTSVIFDELIESKKSCRSLKKYFLSDHFAIKTEVWFD